MKKPAPKKYVGVLDFYFETGSEGAMWEFDEDGKTGWEAVSILEAGDHLTVYGEDGKVVFRGKIVPDYKTGWRRYPLNPKYGQQVALGWWVHWIQKGWKPDDWASLFMRKNGQPRLRAELIKKPPRQKRTDKKKTGEK